MCRIQAFVLQIESWSGKTHTPILADSSNSSILPPFQSLEGNSFAANSVHRVGDMAKQAEKTLRREAACFYAGSLIMVLEVLHDRCF